MSVLFRRAYFCTIVICFVTPTLLSATEKLIGNLTVRDSLIALNQAAIIEATLTWQGTLTETALGGEPIELLVAGAVVSTAITGRDGRGFLSYTPKGKGIIPVTVRLGPTPRVTASPADATLAVWERRGPIMAVEMVALLETMVGQSPLLVWPGKDAEDRRPMLDAAEELDKLTQFYYNVLYVVTQDQAFGRNDQVARQVRQWLKTRKFPSGHVLVLSSGSEVFGAQLDALHSAGWTTLRVGVGRTKAFAEVFLQRRLAAVMVPEPSPGGAPRKAKVAKVWKDVRKKI